jgi:uncharacterized protein (UPF0335 family)
MKIDAERLRGILDCMHDEADERDTRSAQIRDIVKAAKEAGYDTKAVRKVFTRERMDEAERSKQDDLLETYEGALGGKGRALQAISEGVPVGEACAANGVHRATVARARHVANGASNATPPHDSETGEIIEEITVEANNDGPYDHDSGAEEIGRPMTADDLGDPLLVTNPFRAKVKTISTSVRRTGFAALSEPGPQAIDTRTPDEIMGEIPARLRRVRA